MSVRQALYIALASLAVLASNTVFGILRPEYVYLTNTNMEPAFEHWFKLDENSASTSILDSVTGNTGSAVDNTDQDDNNLLSIMYATGLHSGWDGVVGTVVNEPITLASSPGATCTSGVRTIAGMFAAPTPNGDPILSVTDRSSNRAWEIGSGNSGGSTNRMIEFRSSQDGSTNNKIWRTTESQYPNVTQTAYNAGLVYMHIAVTIDPENEEIKIYVNGREVESAAITNNGTWGIFASNADLVLGNYDGGDATSQCPVIGSDIRIYSRVLTAKEILALAQPHHISIDPTSDTYYGVIPEDDDLYPALQLTIDTMGSSINHATLHRLSTIAIPDGSWELTQAVVTPNTSAQGAKIIGVGRSESSSSEVKCVLNKSSSWVGDSVGLIEVRGSGWQIEGIAFVGTSTGVTGDQTGVGVHLTRGPTVSGSAPSSLTVSRCRGVGLLSLGKAGWNSDENNCDFYNMLDCSIDNCGMMFHNANEQGQMQRIEGPTGEPTTATVYAEYGGPIWIRRFGSAGDAPVLLIGSPGAQTAQYILDTFKFDSQASVDTKIVVMEEPGPAHVIVQNGFITNGERGDFGTNFIMKGESHLTVRNVMGPGKVTTEVGTQSHKYPTVIFDACKWFWGPATVDTSADSPAILIKNDPTVLIDGTASLDIINGTIGTRYTQGTIDPNPQLLKDYRTDRRPISVNVVVE